MRMSPLISPAGHSRREELKAIFMLKQTRVASFREVNIKSNPRKSITQARSSRHIERLLMKSFRLNYSFDRIITAPVERMPAAPEILSSRHRKKAY